MNNKGIALVFSFIVILVLTILLGSVFLKTMNENNLVRRNVNSAGALWLAEAGVSEAVRSLPADGSGALSSGSYNYNTEFWETIGENDYYNITSIGTVSLPTGNITRQISAVARTPSVNADRFPYSLASSGGLCFGGNCGGDADKYIHPQPDLSEWINGTEYPEELICPQNETGYEGECWRENKTDINFLDLFGYQASEIKASADYVYNVSTFPGTGIHGVTWVDVPAGQKLPLTGGGAGNYSEPDGTGILFVNGDVEMAAGTYLFRGIIYVKGEFHARGTFDAYGSVLVEANSTLEEDESSINGNPDFFHSKFDIEEALKELAASSARVVSWRETTP